MEINQEEPEEVVLTARQIQDVEDCFKLFDPSGNNLIDLEQMILIFRSLGQTPTKEETENMISEAEGSAKMQKVNLNTALTLYNRYYAEPLTEQDLRDSFKKLDETKCGFLGVRRIRMLLKN